MPIRTALLAYDDCALHSLSRVSGLLLLANRANEELGRPHPKYEWQVVSSAGGPVQSGPGVRVLADTPLGSARFDVLSSISRIMLSPETYPSSLSAS